MIISNNRKVVSAKTYHRDLDLHKISFQLKAHFDNLKYKILVYF